MNKKAVWLIGEVLVLTLVFSLIITCFQNYTPMAASPEDSGAVAELRVKQTADGARQMAAIISVRESRVDESISIEESIAEVSRSFEESIAEVSRSVEESIAVSIAQSIEESIYIEESIAESIYIAESQAEESRKAEEARRAAEEARKAEEARRAAEEARRAEEARIAAERAAATMPAVGEQAPGSGGPAVLIGDSRTSEFYHYGLLPKSQVYYLGGGVYAMYDIAAEAAATYPSKAVFMCGQNDLGIYAGDAGAFISEYTNLIRYFIARTPNTQIYVNLIIPDTPAATAQMPGREKVGDYNAAIVNMCAQNGWTCIDASGGFDPSFYGPDGIHFHTVWYPIWLNNIRSLAGF